jgi:cyclopropane fatty-acyl-phospholipid synthase-like methyltransferase
MFMDRYKETFETWNKLASLYQDKFMDLDLYDATYDYVCQTITKPKAKLLEIGCGPGNITKYLLSQRPDFNLYGIDISPNMIALAQQNNPTAHFAVLDCRAIHTLEKGYDGIIGGFCLPYLSQAESSELIATSYNLLNQNGLLYLSFVEGNPEASDFKIGIGGRVYFYYHDLETITSHLLNLKFKEIKTFKVKYKTSDTTFDIHTIVTAIK